MTKQKLLKIGLVACILGAGLMWLGSTSGGLNDLINHQTKTANVRKESKEFSEVNSLDIQLSNKSLIIGESPDDKVHLTYYHGDGKNDSRIETSLENGTLKIVERYSTFPIKAGLGSILQMIQDFKEDDQSKFLLTLPKGKQLDSLKADLDNGRFEGENIRTKESQFTLDNGSFTAENLSSDKAEFTMHNGAVKLINPQIQSGQLTNDNGQVQIEKGMISNSQFTLHNGAFNVRQVSWSGDISIKNDNGGVDVAIPEKNLQNLSFELQSDISSIKVPDNFQQIKNEITGSSATKTAENGQGRLKIHTNTGGITITSQ